MSDVQLSKGEAMDLARRAVACKAWRWMPGMRTSRSRMVSLHKEHPYDEWLMLDEKGDNGAGVWSTRLNRMVPDLTDPATLGCLLALVREVWGEGGRLWQGDGGTWVMEIGTVAKCGDTEAEALVRALEAAP